MGTLGEYLREAREAQGMDLRDAALRTRISIHYLKALEEQDFTKLPGDVFVKGFLKNYGRFLNLDETEILKKYNELTSKKTVVSPATEGESSSPVSPPEQKTPQKVPLEPFIWAAGILIILIIFFFTALPARNHRQARSTSVTTLASHTTTTTSSSLTSQMVTTSSSTYKTGKLYLEVVALENTWLLVRTDTSPQKKAVLQKGETLTWSALERFQLSYGSVGAVKLSLNGRELTVNEPKNTVVRDLTITEAGIVSRKIQPVVVKPKKPKQAGVLTRQTQTAPRKPVVQPQQQNQPVQQQPVAQPQPKPATQESPQRSEQ